MLHNNFSSFSFCSMGKTWSCCVADSYFITLLLLSRILGNHIHSTSIFVCWLFVFFYFFFFMWHMSLYECFYPFWFEPVLLHCWVIVESLNELSNFRLTEDDSYVSETFLWLCLAHYYGSLTVVIWGIALIVAYIYYQMTCTDSVSDAADLIIITRSVLFAKERRRSLCTLTASRWSCLQFWK